MIARHRFTVIAGVSLAGAAVQAGLALLLNIPAPLDFFLHSLLCYASALLLFRWLARLPAFTNRAYLLAPLAGSLVSGFFGLALGLWGFTSLAQLLFDLTVAGIIGWSLSAAATVWGRRPLVLLLGLLVGSLMATLAFAWLPVAQGVTLALGWGVKTFLYWLPLVVGMLLLRPPNDTQENENENHHIA